MMEGVRVYIESIKIQIEAGCLAAETREKMAMVEVDVRLQRA